MIISWWHQNVNPKALMKYTHTPGNVMGEQIILATNQSSKIFKQIYFFAVGKFY